MKLLQNPLIKIAGICVILYFALFSNKHNPQSLSHRLSGERLKNKFVEMEEKGRFIASNVQAAKSYAKFKEVAPEQQKIEPVIAETMKIINYGAGKDKVVCGSEVEVFLSLNSDSVRNIALKPSAKFVIGSKENWLLEKHILGMKVAGVREIRIPKGFKTEDPELKRFQKENNVELFYQIVLKAIKAPEANSKLNCE